tara:strand:+ start:235 stop:1053 length:819 start_codon:yes stop_codon:yes gene_type:complete
MTEYIIESPDNEMVQDFIGLNDHHLRQSREQPGGDMAGYFIGEGVPVIDRALASGHRIVSLLVDQKFQLSRLSYLPAETPVLRCDAPVIEAIAGRSELKDPIGSFVRPEMVDLHSLLEETDIMVITEGVQNPTNMGMIMRNAAAFGVDAVCVDSSSCDPLYRRAVRVSMGQVFAVPHVRISTVPEIIRTLHQEGFDTVALAPTNIAVDLSVVLSQRSHRLALIVGSEGPGLSQRTLAAVKQVSRIPMMKNVDSLNVATAVAIALYAVRESQG